PSIGLNELVAIDSLRSNAWAIGDYLTWDGSYMQRQSYLEYWDGNRWSLSSVIPGTAYSLWGTPSALEVLAPNDIWILGSGPQGPATAHWDGSHWAWVPSPRF